MNRGVYIGFNNSPSRRPTAFLPIPFLPVFPLHISTHPEEVFCYSSSFVASLIPVLRPNQLAFLFQACHLLGYRRLSIPGYQAEFIYETKTISERFLCGVVTTLDIVILGLKDGHEHSDHAPKQKPRERPVL